MTFITDRLSAWASGSAGARRTHQTSSPGGKLKLYDRQMVHRKWRARRVPSTRTPAMARNWHHTRDISGAGLDRLLLLRAGWLLSSGPHGDQALQEVSAGATARGASG